mgnify:CR=1 FL=1
MALQNRYSILGIDRVTFAVADLAEARRFIVDWGLVVVDEPTGDGFLARSRDGSEVAVVAADPTQSGRSVVGGDPSGAVSFTWGVSDPAELSRLAEDLGRDREVRWEDGELHSTDDLGFGLVFRPTRRHQPVYEPTRYNSPGRPDRLDRRAARYEAGQPFEISHAAIGVDDAAAAARFYVDRLGFIVSDRYADRGIFLRAAPVGNHHHLFMMSAAAAGTRLNHLAFKVRDVHEVIGGGQKLDERGWKTFAGPGRHMVSSACFWYFQTPLGSHFEYAADEDVVTEDWPVTDFAAQAHIFSEWTFGLEKSDGTLRGPIAHSKTQKLD